MPHVTEATVGGGDRRGEIADDDTWIVSEWRSRVGAIASESTAANPDPVLSPRRV
jgi:hypothetical protein